MEVVIFLLYLVALIVINFLPSNKSKNSSVSSISIMTLVFGLSIGAAATIGVAENAYKNGFFASLYTVAWGIGIIAFSYVGLRKIHKYKIKSIPRLIKNVYGNTSYKLANFVLIVLQIILLSTQFKAAGAILATLLPNNFSVATGILFSSLIFLALVLFGGGRQIFRSSAVNIVLVLLGAIICVVYCFFRLNFLNIAFSITDFFNPGVLIKVNFNQAITWIIVMATQAFSVQSILSIANMSSDIKKIKKAFIISSLFIIPIGLFFALIGFMSRYLFPDISPVSALPSVFNAMNSVAAGILLASLWAADVSTATGHMIGGSDLLLETIGAKRIQKKTVILLLCVLSTLISLMLNNILDSLMVGLSLTTSFTIILLLTMYFPKICKKSNAFITILCGVIALIVWIVYFSNTNLHSIYLQWIFCPCGFLLSSLFDKRKITLDIGSTTMCETSSIK